MKLENSFPMILSHNISDEVWKLFDSLPKDYKRFLDNTNGGFAKEFEYTFETGVPHITEKTNNSSRSDCIVEFYGVRTVRNPKGGFPKDLIEIAVEYAAEDFLPLGIIAIASCVENDLVCLSLRKNDFGQVFYWDWSWQYPWSKDFFQTKIQKVLDMYPETQEALADPKHDLHRRIKDGECKINCVTVHKKLT